MIPEGTPPVLLTATAIPDGPTDWQVSFTFNQDIDEASVNVDYFAVTDGLGRHYVGNTAVVIGPLVRISMSPATVATAPVETEADPLGGTAPQNNTGIPATPWSAFEVTT